MRSVNAEKPGASKKGTPSVTRMTINAERAKWANATEPPWGHCHPKTDHHPEADANSAPYLREQIRSAHYSHPTTLTQCGGLATPTATSSKHRQLSPKVGMRKASRMQHLTAGGRRSHSLRCRPLRWAARLGGLVRARPFETWAASHLKDVALPILDDPAPHLAIPSVLALPTP